MTLQTVLIIVTVAVCLLGFAGALYGILTHKEPTGMVEVKVWRKDWVPLTLLPSDQLEGDARLMEAIKSAARFWNEQTGVKLFMGVKELALEANLLPVLYPTDTDLVGHEDSVAFARLRLKGDGSIKSGAVFWVTMEHLPQVDLNRAMKHELGHCLGLGHDDGESSVMHGKLSKRAYRVSTADKVFLREVYG